MSIKNGKDYLYLIWKCESKSKQYIVGQLSKNDGYEFQYSEDVEEALENGFTPLIAFPDITAVYKNNELFAPFMSRLPDPKRRDIGEILKKYHMEEYDPYELLKRSGARLPIDNLQFIDPVLDDPMPVKREFYVAGARHYLKCSGNDCNNAIAVTRGDEVFLEKEPDNTKDHNAIKVLNESNEVLGYVPRFYSEAFTGFINSERKISCHVINVGKDNCCNECVELQIVIQ